MKKIEKSIPTTQESYLLAQDKRSLERMAQKYSNDLPYLTSLLRESCDFLARIILQKATF